MKQFAFDKAYYDRFYHDRRTRVVTKASIGRLAKFVTSYLKYLQLPVESVLDIGCGLGYWQQPILREFPKASYTGVEYSEYLCEQHGWEQGSVVDYAPGRTFDLVICQGVLQYLSDSAAKKALRNLGKLCRGALYLEALTQQDWETICDQSVTDGSTHLRTGAWYLEQLDRSFLPIGGGVFLARSASACLFELETLKR